MNETIKRRWMALDGLIVFDFTINRDAHIDNIPSAATISSNGDATSAVTVSIALTTPNLFDLKFRSGHFVKGYLRQTPPTQIDGMLQSHITGDFYYGTKDIHDARHFEGVMASVPVRAPRADES